MAVTNVLNAVDEWVAAQKWESKQNKSMTHQEALNDLKSYVMARWNGGDPVCAVYLDSTWTSGQKWLRSTPAELVLYKRADMSWMISKSRNTARPAGRLAPEDYAFLRTYTVPQT